MKTSLALFVAAFAVILVGCGDTLYDPKTGHKIAHWQSDRTAFYYDGNGVQTGSQSALLSPIYRENWHGGSKVAGKIANGIIGYEALKVPTFLNSATSGASAFSDAFSSRQPATPTPSPAPAIPRAQ